MAAVAVTLTKLSVLEDGRKINDATLVLGDGAATYPALGIPVTKASLGLSQFLDSLLLSDEDSASTNLVKFDLANSKLRIYVETVGVYAEMTGVIPAGTLKAVAIGA